MRKIFWLTELLIFWFSVVQAQPNSDIFDEALFQVGLTKETMRFDYDDMSNFGGDQFLLPLFTTLHRNPFKIPEYTRVFKDAIANQAGSLENLLVFASLRLREGIRRNLIGDPIEACRKQAQESEPLFKAIVEVYRRERLLIRGDQLTDLRKRCQKFPSQINGLLALLVYTTLSAQKNLDQAFVECKEFELKKMRAIVLEMMASDSDVISPDLERFLKRVDYKYLYAGAEDLARAVDQVSDSLAKLTVNIDRTVSVSTPWGIIRLSGTGNDQYQADEHYFIIIDMGGDDRYHTGGATVSLEQPASVLIDMSGNDHYQNTNEQLPAFGAGVLGYGFLVDRGGDDVYKSVSNSEGAGLFGYGALLDRNGQDCYEARSGSQGAGIFGIGILSDLSGDDTYYTFLASQGFGYTKGCGILIELGGNDIFTADDSTILFPSSQTKLHNNSLSQGVGFGRRADISDGHSWAGGIGFMIDMAGDDKYSAGLFAQGCAYWYGIGILADNQGDDQYTGVWYVQGSGAHFGVGILNDVSGNDLYRATMNMAQGAGHDFTIGMLIEEAGNDVYQAPNLSLGGGNDNGIGIFWDKRGNDTYSVSEQTTLGRANITAPRGGLRDLMLCLGLFVDTGGNDTYSKPFAINNTVWTQRGLDVNHPLDTEKGVGIDTEAR